jgi:hypothetical protein
LLQTLFVIANLFLANALNLLLELLIFPFFIYICFIDYLHKNHLAFLQLFLHFYLDKYCLFRLYFLDFIKMESLLLIIIFHSNSL